MNYYMGVDAGGSKTHCLIVDAAGNVCGIGISGNGNHQTNPDAEKEIVLACNQALIESHLRREDITFAYFGLAGADREPDYRVLRPMIARLQYPRTQIACDTMIAMRAGSEAAHGAVVISGTGFNAAARNRAGQELQYGGFGYLFGDGQGSGRDLANLAFRAAVRAWDLRGPQTLLQGLVLRSTGFNSIPEALDAMLDEGYAPPLQLAEQVFIAAEAGDGMAEGILREQGSELGNAAAALIRRLQMEEDHFDLVLGGSVLSKSVTDLMRESLAKRVHETAPHARIRRIVMEPVAGAVLSAMDQAGYVPQHEAMQRIKMVKIADKKEC